MEGGGGGETTRSRRGGVVVVVRRDRVGEGGRGGGMGSSLPKWRVSGPDLTSSFFSFLFFFRVCAEFGELGRCSSRFRGFSSLARIKCFYFSGLQHL